MSRVLVERGFNKTRRRLVLDEQNSCYHLISRAPFGFYSLKEGARNIFVKQLYRQAGFCGVEILAYCLMSNHIHILLRIPYLEEDDYTDSLLLRRYLCLYGGTYVPESSYTPEEVESILKVGDEKAERLRKALRKRMGNVSVFMRELKQRYTFWYNTAHENKGSVWSGRFRSQLVENHHECLAVVAAYIDLNPVRAQMVVDPADYAYSSYGAAMRGKEEARDCYRMIYHQDRLNGCMEDYRVLLYGKGASKKVTDGLTPSKDQGQIPESRAEEVIRRKGAIPMHEAIRYRMRHFSEGGAIGSRNFIEKVFAANRDRFGAKRKNGSRKLRGVWGEEELFLARDLS